MTSMTSCLWMLTALTLVGQILCQCPDAEDFAPCTCDGEGFNCMRAYDHRDLQNAFKSYSNIRAARTLYMQGTNVSLLTPGIFGHFAIQTFYLDFNNITTIESGAFKASENLTTVISLYRNNIKDFPFQDMSKFTKLEVLNLGFNKLTTIPANAFGACPDLQSIILMQNRIVTIGSQAFNMLPVITDIGLANNRITSLGPDSFALTSEEKELKVDLGFNGVNFIDPEAISGLTPKYLLLNNNNITTLPEEQYHDLVVKMASTDGFISVSGNKMTCDCNHKWLLESDEAYKVIAGFVCADGRNLVKFGQTQKCP